MTSFRKAAVALATAGALTLSATPALAADTTDTTNTGATNTATANDSSTGSSTGSSGSSNIGNALGASESEKGVWGSSKGEGATTFGWIWYAYTLAATAAAIGGVVAYNADNIENAAAQFGVNIKLPF